MSLATDAEIIRLQREGNLPSDFGLEADYGGPKTTLEKINEFFLDLPGNLTGELIPKANPYGRLSESERRVLDANRQATLTDALRQQTKKLIEEQQGKIDARAEKTRQQNREASALDLDQNLDAIERIEKIRADSALRQIERAGQVGTQQSIAQMQALMPYLDEAGSRATQRALAASERFKAFKERLPSSIQAIMASKQQQLDTAADSFLKQAQAAATQQQAATNFASLGTGRYIGRRIA